MTIYRFGPFRLEREPLLLFLGDTPLAIGPKVVETLLALVEHPGDILGKAELLDRIWPEGYVEEANLAQNVYVIRKTLRAHWDCNAIETVPRRGYRFSGDVTVEVSPAHASEPAFVAAPSSRKPLRYAVGAALAVAAVLAAAIGIGTANVNRPHAHAPVASTQGLTASGERLFAMGKFYWNQRTAESVGKSLRYFEAVTQSDPRDARGYAGLASAYAIEADYGFGRLTKKAALARAAAFAHEALAIDPGSAEAHAVLGLVAVESENMARGFVEYRRALALDPSYAPAHQWYGASLLMSGQAQAAYDELQKAANLDPESVAATDWLAQASFVSRHYKDAIAYARQALDLSPKRYGVYSTIGLAYEELGNYRGAIAAYRTYARTCESCRFDAAALLAHVYAVSRDPVRAEQEIDVALRGVQMRRADPDNAVAALVAMGRTDEALHVLQRAKSSSPYALLAVDPRMDAVRNDPRFRQYTQGPG